MYLTAFIGSPIEKIPPACIRANIPNVAMNTNTPQATRIFLGRTLYFPPIANSPMGNPATNSVLITTETASKKLPIQAVIIYNHLTISTSTLAANANFLIKRIGIARLETWFLSLTKYKSFS